MTTEYERTMAEVGHHFQALGERLAASDGGRLDPDRVVRLAAASIESARHCAVTLLRPGTRARTLSATDAVPDRVDDLQYTTGEGPCLDASHGVSVVVSGDLSTEERWPRFGPRCVEQTGIRSMMSIRLSLGADDEAAVNFYSPEAEAFTDTDVHLASVIAPFAALAVEQSLRERDTENLRAALSSSRQIGTAVGIIMARHVVTSEQAFELLREASQNLNRKLRDVAAEVEETGALPDVPQRGATRGQTPADGASGHGSAPQRAAGHGR